MHIHNLKSDVFPHSTPEKNVVLARLAAGEQELEPSLVQRVLYPNSVIKVEMECTVMVEIGSQVQFR